MYWIVEVPLTHLQSLARLGFSSTTLGAWLTAYLLVPSLALAQISSDDSVMDFQKITDREDIFTAITTGPVVTSGGGSAGSSWGDYDNDGDLDLFVANSGNNFLYTNNGGGSFTAITTGPVVTDGGISFSGSWGDYDNDGDLDLFVANSGNNFLYANNGDGSFTAITTGVVVTSGGTSFGSSWGDYDNDGDLDLFVANFNQNNFLYANNGNANNWINLRLLGTHSNVSALGAKVHIKATLSGVEMWQLSEISGQTGGGYGGQNSLNAEFGLGDATIVDSIRIEWPRGIVWDTTNVAVNQFMTTTEPVMGLPPSAPTSLVAVGEYLQVRLFWASNQETDLSHYVVYQSLVPDFTPSLIDSVAVALVTDTTVVIPGLSSGTIYYFCIAARDQTGNLSRPSLKVIAAPTATTDETTSVLGVVGNGEVSFRGTGLTLDFTFSPQIGTDTIHVTKIATTPGGNPPPDVTILSSRHWEVIQFGSSTFSANIIFDMGPDTISTTDQADPSGLKLLQRPDAGTVSWSTIASGNNATDSTVSFTGITGFSQFTIGREIDTEGPTITGAAISPDPNIGDPLTVSATVTDASGTRLARLYYTRGELRSFVELPMFLQGNESYSGTIPDSAVTVSGVAYFVYAEDNLGNVSRSDTISIQLNFPSGVVTTRMAGSAFASGFPYDKWRLISLPGDVSITMLLSTIQDELGSAPSDTTWGIFRYVGPGLYDYQEATSFVAGENYFLKQVTSKQPVHFNLGSGQTYDLTGLSITMQPRKWHFVSAPYLFPVAVDANQSIFIGPYTYGAFGSEGQEGWSTGQVQTTFEPWGGYIIYNNTDQTRTLDIRSTALSKVILSKRNTIAAPGWLLNLTAIGQDYFDTGNIIGRTADATEGLDGHDHPEPPTVGDGYLSITVGEYDQDRSVLRTSDIRSIQVLDGEWDLAISTKGESGPIKLTYSLEGNPPSIIALIDLLTQEVYRLSEGEHPAQITNFNERVPYSLKVVAGSESYVSQTVQNILEALPKGFTLSQNFPNPFNPFTTIEYALPSPTRVSLRIYNLIGQEITTLLDNWQDMGYHETIWYGRDRFGRRVASGVYFVVLRANGHILTRKMVLLK